MDFSGFGVNQALAVKGKINRKSTQRNVLFFAASQVKYHVALRLRATD
jgi:hypothetical protein